MSEDQVESLTGDGADAEIEEVEAVDPTASEPTPVGGHLIQDNVTDPDNPAVAHSTGVTQQDNVTEPGVQNTVQGDGYSSKHVTPHAGNEIPDGATPSVIDPAVLATDGGEAPLTPGSDTPPQPDVLDVEIPVATGTGWINVPIEISSVNTAELVDPVDGVTVSISVDQDDTTQTCLTVNGAPEDVTDVAVIVTYTPPAEPPPAAQ